MDDVLVKVVAITFEAGGRQIVHVEHIGRAFGVQRFTVDPGSLHGDPDYDRNLGGYPDHDTD